MMGREARASTKALEHRAHAAGDRTVTDHLANLSQARDFLQAVEPMLPAYPHGVFSYVAVTHEGETVVLRARLDLSIEEPVTFGGPVATATLCAGQARIKVSAEGVEACIRSIASGAGLPPVDDHLLKLLPRTPLQYSQGYSAHYEHCQPPNTVAGQHIHRLTLSGINRFQILNTRLKEIERELRDIGIDTVEELLRRFELRGSDDTTFELTAGPVAMINPESCVEGRHVSLRFRLAKELRASLCRVTVRNADSRAAHLTEVLRGESIQWTDQGNFREGQWEFDLPESAIVDCRIIYNGLVQQDVRLADQATLPNARRRMVDLVDPELRRLGKLLTDPKRTEGRDFEAGIAWLFQLLGFAPVHVGAMSGLTDEPDVFVMAPAGEVLIAECTIGVPDDDKLTLLVSRVARLRESAARSLGPSATGEIIGMLICARPPEELVSVRGKADEHGVLVLCRPEIEAAVARTQFAPDPAATLHQWRNLALMQILTGGRPLV